MHRTSRALLVSRRTLLTLLTGLAPGLLALGGCGGSADVSVTAPSLTRCGVTATASTSSVPAAGGSGTLAISTERECEWVAASESDWLTLNATKGQGPGSVGYAAAANPDSSTRRGALVVGQQRLEIAQEAAPCLYEVVPTSIAVAAAETRSSIAVRTAGGCRWSVQTATPWVRAEPAEGAGPGTVQLSIAANPGPGRSATLTLAGIAVSISQAATSPTPCTYAVTPGSLNAPASGAQPVVSVVTTPGCAWSATPDAPWMAILEGATGSGSGTVRVSIAPNPGEPRSGRAVIAGQAFVVQQAGTTQCGYVIRPTYYNSGPGPDDVTVQVTASQGCVWTASGEPAWVNISEGRTGSGNGTVRLLLAANAGEPRTATLTIAGQPFALSQEGSCHATIKPTYYNAGRGPDEFEVTVTAAPGCRWTATSPVEWARIQSGANGSGNGTVTVRVNPNNDVARSAVLTIGGQEFRLTQQGRP